MRRISATMLVAVCAGLGLAGCAATGNGTDKTMDTSVSGERSGSMTSGSTGTAGATSASGTTGAVDAASPPANATTTPPSNDRR